MGKQNFDNGKKLLTYCVVYQYYYCIISYKVPNNMSNKRKLYLFMRTTVRTIFSLKPRCQNNNFYDSFSYGEYKQIFEQKKS
jgi:hypothetical protein